MTEVAGVSENSNWGGDAERDVANGLLRLAQLAIDEVQAGSNKSVEEVYNERLAKLLAAGPMKFHASSLE